jgi:hypothetical protein
MVIILLDLGSHRKPLGEREVVLTLLYKSKFISTNQVRCSVLAFDAVFIIVELEKL